MTLTEALFRLPEKYAVRFTVEAQKIEDEAIACACLYEVDPENDHCTVRLICGVSALDSMSLERLTLAMIKRHT